MSGPLIWIATSKTNNKIQAWSTEKSWNLGIGVVVINAKKEHVWKNRTTLSEAGLMKT